MSKINNLLVWSLCIYSFTYGMNNTIAVIEVHYKQAPPTGDQARITAHIGQIQNKPLLKDLGKNLKRYSMAKDGFLRQEAEKVIAATKEKARLIDEHIRAQRNDRWMQESLLHFLFGAELPQPQEALDTLIMLEKSIPIPLDKQLIAAVSERNWYFRNLFLVLLSHVENRYGLDQKCQEDVLITGKNIDQFMNVKSVFPCLPFSMREYLAFKIEESYRTVFRLKECVPFIPHVVRTALYNSRGDLSLLSALRKSRTLRLDKNMIPVFLMAINGHAAALDSDQSDPIVIDFIQEGEQAELEINKLCTCPDGTTIDEENWLMYDVMCYVKNKLYT